MNIIPEDYLDLLNDNLRAYAYLATTMANGSPQVTPVWFNIDESYILVNTAVGRVKDRNMRMRRNVAIAIQDPRSPFRYLQIRGRVVEWTTEGADEHINSLSLKYTGRPWKYQQNQVRVIFKILPESIDAH